MQIKIPYSELPEAKDWSDGEPYELEVTQISHDKTGVTLELGAGEEDDEDQEDTQDNYSRM